MPPLSFYGGGADRGLLLPRRDDVPHLPRGLGPPRRAVPPDDQPEGRSRPLGFHDRVGYHGRRVSELASAVFVAPCTHLDRVGCR